MPYTFAIDTNYVRSLGADEFLQQGAPQKLRQQVAHAFDRGNAVVFSTIAVREIDAWLLGIQESRFQVLKESHRHLTEAGFKIEPDAVKEPKRIEARKALADLDARIAIIEPTLADYQEGERRTSFRLPPLPKNAEGEEMRDRVMWCQFIRHARGGANHFVIVSNDMLFRNGAASEEGANAKIVVAANSDEFDQRLGEVPPHVAALIQQMAQFAERLTAHGINLSPGTIKAIEGLRIVNDTNEISTSRFVVSPMGNAGFDAPVPAILVSVGAEPVRLTLDLPKPIVVEKPNLDLVKVAASTIPLVAAKREAEEDLRRLIGRDM